MTTIAVRDGIMAADSARTHADTLVPIRNPKIKLVGSAVVAGSGSGAVIFRFLQWLAKGKRGRRPTLLFTDDDGDEISARVVVLDHMGLTEYAGEDLALIIDAPFYAIGSGRDFALAAMSCGLSAADAVAKACEFDPWSRPPIQVEALKPARRSRS